MEVLILSKTKYGATQVCIGGICISNNQFIRLLKPGGYYQPADTKFNIGDIWEVAFTVNPNRREPHNEDVTIHDFKFVKKIYALETYIKNMNVPIWRNNITQIFEGKIKWTSNGKGYFSENIKNYPSHSVGFWTSDVDLRHQKVGNQDFYIYQNNGVTGQIVYKGNQTILPIIPKGKLIRLSLAKWWKPEDSEIEARCYLQLSGWYNDSPEPQKLVENIKTFSTPPPIKNYEPPKYQAPKYGTPKYQAPKYETPKPTYSKPQNTSGSCYIATLCYGDFYADEVCSFRDFRDAQLSKTVIGRRFIEFYYRYAPVLSRRLKDQKFANRMIKNLILNPILLIIKTLKLDK